MRKCDTSRNVYFVFHTLFIWMYAFAFGGDAWGDSGSRRGMCDNNNNNRISFAAFPCLATLGTITFRILRASHDKSNRIGSNRIGEYGQNRKFPQNTHSPISPSRTHTHLLPIYNLICARVTYEDSWKICPTSLRHHIDDGWNEVNMSVSCRVVCLCMCLCVSVYRGLVDEWEIQYYKVIKHVRSRYLARGVHNPWHDSRLDSLIYY